MKQAAQGGDGNIARQGAHGQGGMCRIHARQDERNGLWMLGRNRSGNGVRLAIAQPLPDALLFGRRIRLRPFQLTDEKRGILVRRLEFSGRHGAAQMGCFSR